jgi:hypothetical protein
MLRLLLGEEIRDKPIFFFQINGIWSRLRGVRENPSENYLIWCADHILLHDTRGDENCGCFCGLTNGSLVKLTQLMKKKRGVRRGKTRGFAKSAPSSSPMDYIPVDFTSVNESHEFS